MQKSNKSVPMQVESKSLNTKLEALDAQVLALTNEKAAIHTIANDAANRLVLIEQLSTPFVNRKFSFWTALAHLKDYIDIIRQIIEIVKGFKDQYMKPAPIPPNDPAQ